MANIDKVQTLWTGFTGAPGYTTMYWMSGLTNKCALTRTYFDAIKGVIPSTITLQVQSSGLEIDETSGAANGVWSETAVTAVVGTAVGVYAAPSGSIADWLTSAFVAGRRVRGRSFMVPLSGTAYQSDGTLLATAQTTLANAAAALVTGAAGTLGVWHRPVGGSGGVFHLTTSSTVPDKVVVLRSRRD